MDAGHARDTPGLSLEQVGLRGLLSSSVLQRGISVAAVGAPGSRSTGRPVSKGAS